MTHPEVKAKVNAELACHFKAVQELAAVINLNVPDDKKIEIQVMEEDAPVEENTSKLVNFIQNIKNFVDEVDAVLKSKLTSELYTKVTSAAASIEQVAEMVKNKVTSTVGPLVTAIASKLKSSKLLNRLEQKVQALFSLGDSDSDSDDDTAPNQGNQSDNILTAVNQIVVFSKWYNKTFKNRQAAAIETQ